MKLRDAVLFFLTFLAKTDRLGTDAQASHDASEADDPLQRFVDAIAQLSMPEPSDEESDTESWLLPCFRRDGLSIQNIAELFDFSGKESEEPETYQQPLRLWDFISKPHQQYEWTDRYVFFSGKGNGGFSARDGGRKRMESETDRTGRVREDASIQSVALRI